MIYYLNTYISFIYDYLFLEKNKFLKHVCQLPKWHSLHAL